VYGQVRDAKVGALVAIASAAYVLLVGAALQWWVIPATPWHSGAGLLAGGDWLHFHQLAQDVARRIEQEGWQAWVLRPEGQAPAGLAAALYAATGVHKPWLLLPVHALLYALAALCLWRLVSDLSGRSVLGLWAIAPLFMFPSLAMVYGQMHKDIYALPAVLALVLAWVWMLLRGRSHLWWILVLLLLGNVLMWLVRPYGLKLMLLGQAGMLCIFVLGWYSHRQSAALALGTIGVLITVALLRATAPTATAPTATAPTATAPAVTCPGWVYTLPVSAPDVLMARLACTRLAFAHGYPLAGSNIDTHVQFTQAADIVLYLPRALQIGWLAPFPNQWFVAAASPGGEVFRAVAALEMLVLYLALTGLLAFGLLTLFKPQGLSPRQLWAAFAILSFAVLWVLMYTLVMTNVGTLYRMRLPAVLIVMGLGWAAWRQLWLTKSPK